MHAITHPLPPLERGKVTFCRYIKNPQHVKERIQEISPRACGTRLASYGSKATGYL